MGEEMTVDVMTERMPHLPHLLIALTHPILRKVLLCRIQLIMICWLMIFPIQHPNVVMIQSQKTRTSLNGNRRGLTTFFIIVTLDLTYKCSRQVGARPRRSSSF